MKLIRLSYSFYSRYSDCPEILQKPSRPYVCLAIRIDDRTFAIPLRHHISHKYKFSTGGSCGLDYTKAVIITSSDDIEQGTAPRIEQSEFNAIKGMEQKIAKGMTDYVKLYRKALQFPDNPHYAYIRSCSSLQYFEKYL